MANVEYEVTSEFLPCVCGCLEHHAYLELTWWKRNGIIEDCDCSLSLHIAPQPFWSRLKNAFKYIFQSCKKSGSYDEVIIDENRAAKFKILIDKYIEYKQNKKESAISQATAQV